MMYTKKNIIMHIGHEELEKEQRKGPLHPEGWFVLTTGCDKCRHMRHFVSYHQPAVYSTEVRFITNLLIKSCLCHSSSFNMQRRLRAKLKGRMAKMAASDWRQRRAIWADWLLLSVLLIAWSRYWQ